MAVYFAQFDRQQFVAKFAWDLAPINNAMITTTMVPAPRVIPVFHATSAAILHIAALGSAFKFHDLCFSAVNAVIQKYTFLEYVRTGRFSQLPNL
jgi:hypothetical protein